MKSKLRREKEYEGKANVGKGMKPAGVKSHVRLCQKKNKVNVELGSSPSGWMS